MVALASEGDVFCLALLTARAHGQQDPFLAERALALRALCARSRRSSGERRKGLFPKSNANNATMLRRLALIAAMCCMRTAQSDAVDDRLHAMSIKQLRWLLRDLGALDELPKGVALEKSDVIALAAPILRAEEQKKREEINSQRIWLALKVAGMLLVALVFGEPILAATQSARHAFVDGVEEKKHLARYAVECGSLFSAILVLITGVIDLLLCWVRLSVIISWVAPRNSSIRNFTIPIPSLGVDPAMAMGATSGYSINVAPMLLQFVLGRVKSICGHKIARLMAARHRAIRRKKD